uniref:(northern house mosquito) hypothetical protein n=1 Tax=Culex pipiens TaxID=7175 RepID=A0A8D8FZZ2_CULPI
MANLEMTDLIQLIPEFDGSLDSLDQFLMLTDYYADQIPEGEDQSKFLNIVFMKLKFKAAARIKRIYANTWEETKANLIREFGIKTTFGSIIEQIETHLNHMQVEFLI